MKTSGPRISLFAFAALVILAIASAAAVVFLCRGRVEVVVPTENIPAFERISASDLEERTIWKQGSEGTEVLQPSELAGHVALTELESGQPIASADTVQPQVPLSAQAVILEVTPGNASALNLEVGESIVLRLTPKRRGVEPASVSAWLVAIPDDGSTSKQAYAVALGHSEALRVLRLLGRSRLLITPAP